MPVRTENRFRQSEHQYGIVLWLDSVVRRLPQCPQHRPPSGHSTASNHFRAAYGPIATQVHRVAFPAVQSHDPRDLTYHRLRRPIFPLDPI